MKKTEFIPESTTVTLQIPTAYLGKKIEILLYASDEIEQLDLANLYATNADKMIPVKVKSDNNQRGKLEQWPKQQVNLKVDGVVVPITQYQLTLNEWKGAPVADTFGGKPVIDFDGAPVFAEEAVLRLYRAEGWQAKWIETYGRPKLNPMMLDTWHNGPYSQQQHIPITDTVVNEQLAAIAARNNKTFAGCWDIVCWQNGQLLFVEVKRRKKDAIRASQLKWLKAALEVGLLPEQFVVVEWSFE
ncbi:MAG: hypothetical protein EBZ77_06755 [Chitinophagia bacterium]|nr:hypothetical protein [Chitinophagia bacterium]